MSSSFVDEIESVINSGKVVLPVFNPTGLRVQQELVKKEPDTRVIEQLIIRDQVLATEVLRLANSSYYKGLTQVSTVKTAIVRLGMREVGRIVLLAASRHLFSAKDKEILLIVRKLWQHSAGCGLAANWLAQRCGYGDLGSEAFFAALFHDIGKLFILTVIEQGKLRRSGRMTEALMMELVNTLHTEKGYALMQHWNMPSQYCQVVRDHHLPGVDIKDTLLILVRLADMTCNKLGIGIHSFPEVNLAATEEAHLLELQELDLAELEIMLEDTKALTG